MTARLLLVGGSSMLLVAGVFALAWGSYRSPLMTVLLDTVSFCF